MREYPTLDPEYVLVDETKMSELHRTKVTPAYTEDELKKIYTFVYLQYKFLQENELTTRQLVSTFEDTEKVILKVKDLTPEGMQFYRNTDRFLDLKDFNVNPENRVKQILEKELQKLRSS